MTERWTDVLSTRLPDVTVRTVKGPRPGEEETPSRKPLSRAWDVRTRGGMVPSDDDLLERTLAFSGTYVSDDGNVMIRRPSGSSEYSGERFTGYCAICSRAGLIPPAGEPLSDVRAAVHFVAVHSHGDVE